MGSYGKFAATTRREEYPGEYRYVVRVTDGEDKATVCRIVVRINMLTLETTSVHIERSSVAMEASPELTDAAIRRIAEVEVNALPGLPSYVNVPGAGAEDAAIT